MSRAQTNINRKRELKNKLDTHSSDGSGVVVVIVVVAPVVAAAATE